MDTSNEHCESEQNREILLQKLHEFQMKLKTTENMLHDYQEDTSKEIKEKDEKIKELKNEQVSQKTSLQQENNTLKDIIAQLEQTNLILMRNVKDLKSVKETTEVSTNLINNSVCSLNNTEFNEERIELTNQLAVAELTNKENQEKIKELEKENENLSEALKNIKLDLCELKDERDYLKTENFTLSSELNGLKNNPLKQGSQGNSLFAEVNDHRLHLEEQIIAMKKVINKHSDEKAQLQKTIDRLRHKNAQCAEEYYRIVQKMDNDEYSLNMSLRKRIEELEHYNKIHREMAETKPLVISTNDMVELEFFELSLRAKQNQILALTEENNNQSMSRLMLVHKVKAANDEKNKFQLEAMAKQEQIDLLRAEIDSVKGDSLQQSVVIVEESVHKNDEISVDPEKNVSKKVSTDQTKRHTKKVTFTEK